MSADREPALRALLQALLESEGTGFQKSQNGWISGLHRGVTLAEREPETATPPPA